MFFQVHRNHSLTTLITTQDLGANVWSKAFSGKIIHKKKIIKSKDLNVVNILIESLLSSEEDNKGLIVADLRDLKDINALNILHRELNTNHNYFLILRKSVDHQYKIFSSQISNIE